MNFFKKITQKKVNQDDPKYQFQQLVKKDGREHAFKRMGQVVAGIVISNASPTGALVKRFVLEELDAARHGNESAVNFVRESGFSESEYLGSMGDSRWAENTELEDLQVLFRNAVNHFAFDMESMTLLTLSTLDSIMEQFNLGKYHDSKQLNTKQSSEIKSLCNEIVTIYSEIQESEDFQSALSLVQAGMPLGIGQVKYVSKLKKIDENIFRIAEITGKSPEDIAASLQS